MAESPTFNVDEDYVKNALASFIPGIPAVGQFNADPKQLYTAVDSLREGLEVLSGTRGRAPLARAATLQDIVDLGLIQKMFNDESEFRGYNSSLSARITTEVTARTTADAAFTTRFTSDESEYRGYNTTTNARVDTEITTRATADTALASDITTLTATVNSNYSTLSASITTEATTRASADTAISSTVTTLTATVTSNFSTLSASITTEASVRASADTSEASTRGSADTTLGSRATTLEAKYGVTLDVNGYVTGWAANNNGSSGSFTVITDYFNLVKPGSLSPFAAFNVSGGEVYFQGLLTADKIRAGTIASQDIYVNGLGGGAYVRIQGSANNIHAHDGTRVRAILGQSGGDYGLWLYNSAGTNIISASGLGISVADTSQLVSEASTAVRSATATNNPSVTTPASYDGGKLTAIAVANGNGLSQGADIAIYVDGSLAADYGFISDNSGTVVYSTTLSSGTHTVEAVVGGMTANGVSLITLLSKR